MNPFALLLLAYLALNAAFAAPVSRSGPAFDQLVAFGDSYIDNGNGSYTLTNHTWPADPAYFHGRFSNGPVWPEYLASHVSRNGKLTDRAYGGATINNTLAAGATGYGTNITVPDVLQQVKSYVEKVGSRGISHQTLFVLDGGGNDAFYGNFSLYDHSQLGQLAAKSMVVALEHLAKSGARHFVVPRTPSLSRSPYGLASLNASSRAELNDFSRAFSNALTAGWRKAQRQGARATFIDQSKVLLSDKTARLFKNTHDACLTGVYPGVDNGTRTLCAEPDTYLYWDAYHPTTHGHKLLAKQAAKALGFH